MIDERTERLINRRLDGELSEAESLELDKRLIRSPEARQLFETYARNDLLAGEALRACTQTPPPTRQQVSCRRWFRWSIAPVGLGVAAAVLAISFAHRPAGTNLASDPPPRPAAPITTLVATPQAADAELPLIEGPREETHQLYRNVLGIYDQETQSVYVLELDQRARTVIPVAMNF